MTKISTLIYKKYYGWIDLEWIGTKMSPFTNLYVITEKICHMILGINNIGAMVIVW